MEIPAFERLWQYRVKRSGWAEQSIFPTIAVGMPITEHPPHRAGRAAFPHPAPNLGCLTAKCPYTVQSRGHACPARSPARAGLSRVLLGPLPSLHQLRLRSPDAVRRLRSYYGEV